MTSKSSNPALRNDGTVDATIALMLPRLTSAEGCQECRFSYGCGEWVLRHYVEMLGDDKLMRYSLYLGHRELDPFVLLGREQWQRWSHLPYDLPDPLLVQGDLPSELLCDFAKAMLDAYIRHADQASCFWPIST